MSAARFSESRKQEAARLRPFEKSQRPIFVALAGSKFEHSETTIAPGFKIRIDRIAEPPGIFEILNAADHQHLDYLGVARLSPSMRAQASLVSLDSWETNLALDGIWNFLVLVRLAASASIWSPAWSSMSWPHMVNHSEKTAKVGLLDPEPIWTFPQLVRNITDRDLAWSQQHYVQLFELREQGRSSRFTMALNEFHSWTSSRDLRQCLATIWIGLEALYGDREDFARSQTDRRSATRKMADRISSFTFGKFDTSHVADLYNRRSEVLHGRPMDAEKIGTAILESHDLLRTSLMQCVQAKCVPLPDWHR